MESLLSNNSKSKKLDLWPIIRLDRNYPKIKTFLSWSDFDFILKLVLLFSNQISPQTAEVQIINASSDNFISGGFSLIPYTQGEKKN